jgi:hypothetical protein
MRGAAAAGGAVAEMIAEEQARQSQTQQHH